MMLISADPLWYKDAVIYELHVRAFSDSNADGIGDFRGLTSKLDYLQDLGVTAIWLLPFYPSPLKDDGYDIADYTDVHPDYGTLQDFKVFLREAHARGLRVITELVINHTSDQHPWFQRARRAPPGSPWRNFYVWSDTPERYREARIIFKDFETSNWTWDPVAKAYYWHRFYHHQPDLNYDNPRVHKAIFQVLDFWMEIGVDGLRLDAIPYLYEREGTNCENLPETHQFLKALRRHIDANYPNRMLLAEANQWPEDAVAYFGEGDECHMAFHFPVMPRMFMALRMEDRFPIVDILTQTPQIPSNAQWALFLRNHDELTLEMVTDEERDYMYRVYANDYRARINLGIRRRLAPLLGNNRRKVELMKGLLLSLPGTPVLYYGDEIGLGDNIYLGDRNSVRTPMQWSADRNAGFSSANPQKLYLPVIIDPEYHYEAINVEAQQNNPQSLLWWTKRLIALRKRYRAFGRGDLEFVHPDNPKVIAFIRRYENERILIVANLSRFTQFAELDLSAYQGLLPVETFGQTPFPTIDSRPYFLSLGPHTFYWFALQQPKLHVPSETPPAILTVPESWMTVFEAPLATQLEESLATYFSGKRWFGGKARIIKSVRMQELVPLPDDTASFWALASVNYTHGEPELYSLALRFVQGESASRIESEQPQVIVTRLKIRSPEGDLDGLLVDYTELPQFASMLLQCIERRRLMRGEHGEIACQPAIHFRSLRADLPLAPALLRAEQSNTSFVFGQTFILKLYRTLEVGVNPEVEIGRKLGDMPGACLVPRFAGSLEYRYGRETMTLGLLQQYVPNEGNAWDLTLDHLGRFFEDAAAYSELPDNPGSDILAFIDSEPPASAHALIGDYLRLSRLLGHNTGKLHAALAAIPDPNFVPEPFTTLYQRSVYQSLRNLAIQNLQLLRRRLTTLEPAIQALARCLLAAEAILLRRFEAVRQQKIRAKRIRCHGDYHLGQVLYTGKDFVVIDFEGEPARPLSERKIKRSAMRDVAGMLRSFHYAAYTALEKEMAAGLVGPEDKIKTERWALFWFFWASHAFVQSYLGATHHCGFLPDNRDELRVLLDAYLLEKSVYELGYELNNRPEWVSIPIRGLLLHLGAQL